MIIAGTCVGLVFGLMLSAMTFVQSALQTYEISGSFAISTEGTNGMYINGYPNAGNNDFYLAEDMVDAVIYVLRSPRVLNEAINDQQLLGASVEDLASSQTIDQYSGTQIIEMSILWDNPDDGIALWNAIVEQTNILLPQTIQIGKLAVINEAEAEALGIAGAGKAMPMILAVLGCIVGVGYAIMELLVRPTLNNVRDVETFFGLETIGLIPRDDLSFKQKKSLLVEDSSDNSEILQNYSAAAYILRNQLGTKEEHHCFFVTSAINQEGKTTVAANLAVQLSDMEHRTLLIDFDTRNPSLGAMFMERVDYSRSLNALYRGDITEEEAITTLTGYLDLLPTVLEQTAIPMDANVVELIQRLSQKYEYVILDSAPVGMVSNTLSLKQVASEALFVIGYDISTIPEIQKSLEKLDKSGIRVIGCIVNGVQTAKNWMNTTKEEKIKKAKARKNSKEESSPKNGGILEEAQNADESSSAKGTDAKKSTEKTEKQKKKKGRDKKSLFRSKSSKAQNVNAGDLDQQAEAETSKPAALSASAADTASHTQRNVMEDTLDSETSSNEKKMSDQDALQALFKMGIDSQWDNKPEEPEQHEAELTEDQPSDDSGNP